MIDKEKDLAYLKFNLHEMKTHFNEKEDEVHSLKTINDELQSEMKIVKELNLQLKEEFEKEINVRRDNDKLMETKISSLEREVMETKNILIDTNKETSSLKSQLENFNIDANEKFILCRKDIETVKTDISKTPSSALTDDMVKLKQSVKKIQTEVRSTRSHVDKSLNKKTEEIRSTRSHLDESLNKKTEEIRSTRSHLDESLNKKTDEMTSLTSHVRNIENILFCYQPRKNGCIKFKWVIPNYQYYSDTRVRVCSPIFYTHLSGYCFQLFAEWCGKNEGNLSLCLKLGRMSLSSKTFKHKELKLFKVPFTLQIQGKKGNEKIRTVTLSEIDENPDSFTIHPDEDEAREKFVCPNMLVKPSLYDYIINDKLLVSCVFKV